MVDDSLREISCRMVSPDIFGHGLLLVEDLFDGHRDLVCESG